MLAISRNPSMKDDLVSYALLGVGMVEVFGLVVIALAAVLLFSE